MSPEHTALPVTTGALTVSGLPQLSFTAGGVGATASAGQATVAVVPPGITTTGGSTVIVWVHL